MFVVKWGEDATSACQIEFGDLNQGPGGVCIEQTMPYQSSERPDFVSYDFATTHV